MDLAGDAAEITDAEHVLIGHLQMDARLRGERPGWTHSGLAGLLRPT
ncbi:hypothetical protein [Streptomyces sp. NPDC057199]